MDTRPFSPDLTPYGPGNEANQTPSLLEVVVFPSLLQQPDPGNFRLCSGLGYLATNVALLLVVLDTASAVEQ